MNAEQFIEENYFGLKIDCPRDIQTIYQALEDYAEQQLRLYSVGSSLRSENKTRLIEWKELNLLPIRVQNILIMIYEYNYKDGKITYLEDLKWQEFKKYKQAGKWSWAKFQDMRGY